MSYLKVVSAVFFLFMILSITVNANDIEPDFLKLLKSKNYKVCNEITGRCVGPNVISSPAPGFGSSNIEEHINHQGAEVAQPSSCKGDPNCPKSITVKEGNRTIITFLNTFASGEYQWANRAITLLKHAINKNKPSQVSRIEVFSHTDFENVGKKIRACEILGVKSNNACLRELRRKSTVVELENLNVLKQSSSTVLPIIHGTDAKDFRTTDVTYFNSKLLEKIGAKDSFSAACSLVSPTYLCTPTGFSDAFQTGGIRKRLREEFAPYRNAVIVLNYKKLTTMD